MHSSRSATAMAPAGWRARKSKKPDMTERQGYANKCSPYRATWSAPHGVNQQKWTGQVCRERIALQLILYQWIARMPLQCIMIWSSQQVHQCDCSSWGKWIICVICRMTYWNKLGAWRHWNSTQMCSLDAGVCRLICTLSFLFSTN